jgi:VanZ family protein
VNIGKICVRVFKEMLAMKKLIALLMLVAWMGFIYYLSSETAAVSNNRSKTIAKKIIESRPQVQGVKEAVKKKTEAKLNNSIRTYGHFFIYLVLGVLSYSLLSLYHLRFKGLLSVAVSCLYAVFDELHQASVPGRGTELRDILVDASGAVLGVLLVYLISGVLRRRLEPRG